MHPLNRIVCVVLLFLFVVDVSDGTLVCEQRWKIHGCNANAGPMSTECKVPINGGSITNVVIHQETGDCSAENSFSFAGDIIFTTQQCRANFNVTYEVCTEGTMTCRVYGDPHCRTFDGKKFRHHGTCTYILSSCGNFVIAGEFAECKPGRQPIISCLRRIEILYRGNFWVLGPGLSVTNPNGNPVTASMNGQDYSIEINSDKVQMTLNGLITVSFDGNRNADIYVSDTLSGHLTGICGDGDGNPDNDQDYNPNWAIPGTCF